MKTTKIAGLTIHEVGSFKEWEEIGQRELVPVPDEIYFFKQLISEKMPIYRLRFLFLSGNTIYFVVLPKISLQDRTETLERSLAEMHACDQLHHLANPDFLNQHLDGESFLYGRDIWKIDRVTCFHCQQEKDKRLVRTIAGNNICAECMMVELELDSMGVGY
jgi:hypothetical protein